MFGKRRVSSLTAVALAASAVLYAPVISPLHPESAFGSGGPRTAAFSPSPVRTDSDKGVVISPAASTPTINGALTEPIWASAAQLNGFTSFYDLEPTGGNERVLAAYDAQKLYLGFTADDADQSIANVEILLRPAGGNGPYYHYSRVVQTLSPAYSSDWGPGRTAISGISAAHQRSSGVLSAEISIPLASLQALPVTNGQEWQVNVIAVRKTNSSPPSSWSPVRTSTMTDVGGTRVTIVAPIVQEGRMGSFYMNALPGGSTHAWNPQELELIYTGFETKRLTFEDTLSHETTTSVELEWRTPSGIWTTLAPGALTASGGKLHLDFEHPRPASDGTYLLRAIVQQQGSPERYMRTLSFDRHDLIRAGEASYTWSTPAPAQTPVSAAPPSTRVQTLLDLIPEQPGFKFNGIPENPTLRPENVFQWSVSNPNVLTSTHSALTYPNATYPETETLTVLNRNGDPVTIPYYEDASGKRYFFTAHLWYMQREYVLREVPKVAQTDPLGAARLLYRFAEVYEGYAPTNDYLWKNYPVAPDSGPPYPRWGGTWLRWSVAELSNLKYLYDTYAAVRQTDALQVLSTELGEDVEDRLINDMFRPSAEFVRTFPSTNHNYDNWIGLIELGRLLDDPGMVHEGAELLETYVAANYLFDGFYSQQTISYHNQITDGIREAIDALEGWSDPAGYVSPRLGVTLSGLDLSEQFPALSKARDIPKTLIYPNGRYLPIQDTWANEASASPVYDAGSYLLPASGIARMARTDGVSGNDAVALFLMFHGKYGGHYHYDPLNLTLFAEGRELVPDIGYTHTFYDQWTMSTMGHNTVVVDASDMSMAGEAVHGGRAELFAPLDETVQVVRASQQSAYPQTSEYSREPWYIGFAGATGQEGYVLDLFRVSGGSRHEYTLQGDANINAFFESDVATSVYGPYLLPPGTVVTEPVSAADKGDAEGHYYGYIYVRDVEKAELTSGDSYELTLVTEESGLQTPRLKITGIADAGADSELFIGESPSLRATRLYGRSMDTNVEAVKYKMPKMVVRRDGSNLSSQFIHVLEPLTSSGSAQIDQVERLVPDQSGSGDIAVAISYGTTTDIVLSSRSGVPLVVDDMRLEGTLGFIRLENGVITRMDLIGGTLLQKGTATVTGSGYQSGSVDAVMRRADGDAYNGIVVTAPVSASSAGRTVIVERPDGKTNGYRIEAVRAVGGKTVLDIGDYDPGFAPADQPGEYEMLFHPFFRWTGAPTYRIADYAGL